MKNNGSAKELKIEDNVNTLEEDKIVNTAGPETTTNGIGELEGELQC